MKQYVVAYFFVAGGIDKIESTGGTLIPSEHINRFKVLRGTETTMSEVLDVMSELGWEPQNFPNYTSDDMIRVLMFFAQDFPISTK